MWPYLDGCGFSSFNDVVVDNRYMCQRLLSRNRNRAIAVINHTIGNHKYQSQLSNQVQNLHLHRR